MFSSRRSRQSRRTSRSARGTAGQEESGGRRGARRLTRRLLLGAAAAFGLALLAAPFGAVADTVTISHDNQRTAWDPAEPNLAPSAVSSSDFGQQFAATVDGQVYAQPIVAAGTLVVATENNKVYGLNPATGAQKWTVDLGPAWPASAVSCGDLTPNIGVTSTPVYNPATGAVYVMAKVNDGPDVDNPHWKLFALDAATGATKTNFPVTIQGSPDNDPLTPFHPKTQHQRPGLLLLDGVVYAGFGGHCDRTPYAGYVVGVNAATGKQTAMWTTEAGQSSAEGGIWQAGGGLVSDDSGRIFFATGNGIAPAPAPGSPPPSTLGESVVRLGVNADGTLAAQSFFSPYDNLKLNQDDADLGSGGPVALPDSFGAGTSHPHLLVQVGKDGRVYLLDRDNLGGSGQGANGGDAVVGMTGPFHGVWGHPAVWGGDGGYVYTVESNGPLRALRYGVQGGNPVLTSVGTSVDTFGYTSGSPVVTSSGTTSGSALVWVVYSTGPSGTGAQLRAYDAVPQNGVMHLRYSAPIGVAAKFAVPGTDGGRVYVGTRDGKVLGFGRPSTAVLTAQPYDFGSVAVGSTATGTVTVTASRDLTVSQITTDAPFSVSPPQLPATVLKGQTLDVSVGYTPSTWGAATATLSFTTDAGTVGVDLHGNGTQPGLGASPATLDFGEVRTGAAKELGVSIVNTGTQPETITGATAPSAPFTVTNLPSAGTVLPPGNSTVVTVTYTPTAGSDTGIADSGQLVVNGDAGSVTVPLSGTALTGQPLLTVTPKGLDFNTVPVGQSVTKTFDIGNTGTVPLTITKAKAPAGVFSTTDPIAEGQVIAPGDVIHQSVTFIPTDTLGATATYLVKGDDGNPETLVQLAGNTHPIEDYYEKLGGSRGFLSDPVGSVYSTPGGGMAQDYRAGTIYWSPSTGAHEVHGEILAHYKAIGGPGSPLGYPVTDETGTPDGVGRYNHFNGTGGASIYWTPNTHAWAVYGAIRQHWAAMGWERGPLGYPVTDETGTPDGVGRFNHFSGSGGASIYWTPSTGAWAIYGLIRQHWAAMGWERGPLGYPVTDERGTPDGVGRYNHFSGSGGASIYWTPGTGAWAVYGAIRQQWAALGWERGRLGYPTSDEFGITGGRRNNFQHGAIEWYASNGATRVIYY
ncbi:choice-of-anchor D domain-containing protein [Gandjariella thermophila]|uniref:Uncharacterized protein n=1 Tax=Gandjariella thermophila TaxID=1931992 RepID=A0A4D4J2P0_9PSEU|nr:choice-of-anchor D domain-containing protein [Gandjariella thermophila]GDY29684.1 hypothetical protein GTS_13170 [Gandjariella thermophila]